MSQSLGVLLMAYGTPRNLSEVEDYYRSIRGARVPTSEEVEELADRYRRVGGHTPLLEITQDIATLLEQRLNRENKAQYKVYVGMKHWHPFIAEAVSSVAADHVDGLIALPLAPHYSKMSIDGYRSALEEAISSLSLNLQVRFTESWYANPLFTDAVVQRIHEAIRGFPSRNPAEVEVVFTAHSLPRRIQQWGDPYPNELRESAKLVAEAAGVPSWRFAYQSASHTGEPWLGPDILETLGELASEGKKQVLVVPIGFVSDNLEILFDIDIEAQELAKGLEIHLRRIEMLNNSRPFIEALADVVVNGTGTRGSYPSASS
ncbi:MAG: ferrochelatase [Chloroflexi bacterium]|nr:ferrochelatase [Chloroflexota bacterium]